MNSKPLSLAASLLALATACSDDGDRASVTATVATTDSGVLTTSDASSSSTATVPTTGNVTSTTEASGVTEGSSSTSGTVTSEPGSSSGSTGAVSVSTTDASTTGVVDTTGVMSTGTTQACVCNPGDINGCDGNAQSKCADDCLGFEPAPCPQGQKCTGGVCTALFCAPGVKVCEGEGATKQCDGEGGAYEPPVNCQDSESCVVGECLSLCAQAEAAPSTIGCSFIASRVDNIFGNETDSLVVGNTSKTKTATVQLYFTPNGTNVEQVQGGAVQILPGKTTAFQMTNPPLDKVSGLRKGGN